MPNPYAISTFLDAELGEAINHIVDATGFGSATFLIKEFMEKHKDDLIAFWNGQGKDGNTIYDKWLKKWSMTKAEQDAVKTRKEREKYEKLITQYLGLGVDEKQAMELSSAFPDQNPIEVVKIRTYNIQNAQKAEKPIEDRIREIDLAIEDRENKIKMHEGTPAVNRLQNEIAELRKEKELLTTQPQQTTSEGAQS